MKKYKIITNIDNLLILLLFTGVIHYFSILSDKISSYSEIIIAFLKERGSLIFVLLYILFVFSAIWYFQVDGNIPLHQKFLIVFFSFLRLTLSIIFIFYKDNKEYGFHNDLIEENSQN